MGFKLGFTWGDPPKFAGVNLGEVSVHLSANGPGAPASAAYFVVSDAEELFDFHMSNGVTVVEPPADRDYGLRDYRVKDPWGNELGLDIIYIVQALP